MVGWYRRQGKFGLSIPKALTLRGLAIASAAASRYCSTNREVPDGCREKTQGARGPGEMSGPRPLQCPGARTVRPRQLRQCTRDRRRDCPARPRAEGVARQGQLPRAGHRRDRGVTMGTRPPASDWKTDFDHLDPRWIEDPYPIWDDLRQSCPIAHT